MFVKLFRVKNKRLETHEIGLAVTTHIKNLLICPACPEDLRHIQRKSLSTGPPLP